ncbi:hypothetical protein PENTCL1PPCAC_26984, partial [Pristionchus entomophagus]
MAVPSIDGLAEAMTELVIPFDDSDEDQDEMPTSTRSLVLSPSDRLRLFMEGDSFIPAFHNRFEVYITVDEESGTIEFIGLERSVIKCLMEMEKLKEKKEDFVVKKMSIEKDVQRRLTEKRNKKLMEVMESHDIFILHDAFPLSFPTEIRLASMDGVRMEKAIEEIEMMREDYDEDLIESVVDTIIEKKVEGDRKEKKKEGESKEEDMKKEETDEEEEEEDDD